MTQPATAATRRSPIAALVQFGLLAGPLLAMLDSSIVNVAVASMAAELHAPLAAVQAAVSGYLLALGAGLAATSYLARRLGTLPVYRASLIGFTLASAACAAAPNTGALIAGRVLQGLLGAPLVPLAMSMLLGGRGAARSMSPAAGMLLFLAPALGPTVGGALIAAGGWRWVFLVNVPIGAAAVLAGTGIPAALAPGREPGTRLDLPGLAVLSAGLTAVLWGVSKGGSAGWSGPAAWVPLAAGGLLLAGYARLAARRPNPVLDLALLRQPVPALSMALSALASVVTFAAVFLLPVLIEAVQGHTALAAGLAMLPQGIITGLSTVAGQRLLGRVTVRAIVLAGFTVLAVTSSCLLLIGAGTPLWVTAAILAGRAASIGLVITPLLTALTGQLAARQLADANTLFNICQRIAGSLGIAVIATSFTAATRRYGPVTALHWTGALLTVLAAIAAAAAVRLPGQSAETRALPAARPAASAGRRR